MSTLGAIAVAKAVIPVVIAWYVGHRQVIQAVIPALVDLVKALGGVAAKPK